MDNLHGLGSVLKDLLRDQLSEETVAIARSLSDELWQEFLFVRCIGGTNLAASDLEATLTVVREEALQCLLHQVKSSAHEKEDKPSD